MKNLILTLIFTIPLTLWGQGWEQTYDNGIGSSVVECSDGGFIISGSTSNQNEGNILLIKTNESGDNLWTKIFNNNGYGHSVKELVNGGYIIAGGGSGNIKLIKTNEFGDTLWTKTFLSPSTLSQMAYSIDETNDSSYIITGYNVQGTGVILLKTDNHGNTLWNKTYSFGHVGYSVKEDNDGNFIICGQTSSNGWDILLFKTNQNGDTLWTQTYGGSNWETAYGFDQTSDGGFIICGSTKSFGNGEKDLFLIKTNSNGELIWQKYLGGINNDVGEKVKQASDGGYIVVGQTQSFGNGDRDIWLIKTDILGDTIWTKKLGNNYDDFGYSVTESSDNGYVITGQIDEKICLVKTFSPNMSTAILNITNTRKDLLKISDLLGRKTNNLNQPIIEIFDDGSVEKKLIIEK